MSNKYLQSGKKKKKKKLSHKRRVLNYSTGVTPRKRNIEMATKRMEEQRERQIKAGTFKKNFSFKYYYILFKLKIKQFFQKLFHFKTKTPIPELLNEKVVKSYPKNPRHWFNGLVAKNRLNV